MESRCAKAWSRRLSTIVFPQPAGVHAGWLERGLTLLADEERAELACVQARVVEVGLMGVTDAELDRLEALLEQMGGVANPPTHLPVKSRRTR